VAQLIDTTIFITLERRGLALGALAGAIPDEPLALASITAAELLAGVYRADSPGRRARRAAFTDTPLVSPTCGGGQPGDDLSSPDG